MRKLQLLMVAAAVVVMMASVGVASAGSPHFVSASASVDSSGDLVVTWKEAGLGGYVTIDYAISADASATYACINGGSRHPKAGNKESVTDPVGSTAEATSGKAGNINGDGTLLAPPLPPDSTFSCPSGQTLVLAAVSYSNVVITDITTSPNPSITLGGPFSTTFVRLK